MKKNHLLFIIIFSTFISVITMVTWNVYERTSKHYKEDKLLVKGIANHNKEYIANNTITKKDQDKTMKVEDESSSDNDYLFERKVNDTNKNSKEENGGNLDVNSSGMHMKKSDKNQYIYNEIYLSKREESIESYYYDSRETAQSVFKVATSEIQDNLTASDKIKLLYVSLQLGKEDYKKVEEYLYAKDAEEGVLKALKLLQRDLSKKEYEKVRKIAGKFIDMDAAEKLY